MNRTHLSIGIVGIAITLSLCGCKDSDSSPSTNADYVLAHHCTSNGKLNTPTGTVLVENGKEVFVGGGDKPYYYYTCPNGLDLVIDYDELHPNIPKDKP
jgi:hypothetical protein